MLPEFHILLIEDSRADVKIISRAMVEGNIPHRLTVLHDGRHALDYMKNLPPLSLLTSTRPTLSSSTSTSLASTAARS